jgi:hypothetical protein
VKRIFDHNQSLTLYLGDRCIVSYPCAFGPMVRIVNELCCRGQMSIDETFQLSKNSSSCLSSFLALSITHAQTTSEACKSLLLGASYIAIQIVQNLLNAAELNCISCFQVSISQVTTASLKVRLARTGDWSEFLKHNYLSRPIEVRGKTPQDYNARTQSISQGKRNGLECRKSMSANSSRWRL